MIKKLHALLFCLLSAQVNGQNLVPNPSFETYLNCNFNQGDANYAIGWNKSPVFNQPPSHTDYCNSCSSSYGVPSNPWGNENAATGNGYVAITTKVPAWGQYRENIYAQLLSPLSIGVTYSLSFKLSLCDNFKLASDKMGLKFSMFPNISVNNSAHLFATTPVTLQAGWTVITGTFTADSAYNYIGLGNFFDDANTLEILVCASCAQNYNIYYVDDISVTPLASPLVPMSIFDFNGTYCEGDTVNFTDNSSNTPNSWAWSVGPAAGASILNSAAQHASIHFSQPGTYTVGLQASNSFGSGGLYTSTIQIHPNPQLSLTSNTTHVCAGAPVQLLASGANNYTWTNVSQTGSNITVFPQQSGFYQVTGASLTGCKSKDSIFIVVRPVPVLNITATPSVLCFGNSTQMQASGAQSYTWQPGNSNSNPILINPFSTTIYSVSGTNMFGCSASGTISINVLECVDLEEIKLSRNLFMVYPNPVINKEFTLYSSESGQLIIYDLRGRIIHTFETDEQQMHFNIPTLEPGLYQLQFLSPKESSYLKLMVE